MIGSLSGTLVVKNPPELIVEVAGVGYLVDVPMSTFYDLPELGHTVQLLTHLVVREDALQLYGFHSESELRMFQQLLKVNGVGARVALNILSAISTDELCSAINVSDTLRLTKIPGIGKKTAERLILDLKDRIADWSYVAAGSASHDQGRSVADAASNAVSALIALGYKSADAEKVIKDVNEQDMSEEQLIRSALQAMHSTGR